MTQRRDPVSMWDANNEIAKKVAALLAENAVTVEEMRYIFNYVESHLTVAVLSASHDEQQELPDPGTAN